VSDATLAHVSAPYSDPVERLPASGRSPRLALFDLDNTLIDRAAGFRLWAERFLASRALPQSEVEWLEAVDDDGLARRDELFAHVRERYGLTPPVQELVDEYRRDFPGCIPPVVETTWSALMKLREHGWRVGVVSNGTPSQVEKIHASGLARAIDGWAISGVVGARKPDPRLFRAAAQQCACDLSDGWMIGDRADADVAGAIASGLSSAWISRGNNWAEPRFRPDIVADSVGHAVTQILARRSGDPEDH
jgi:putative hydrolase of the HAD superfamily